MHKPLYRITAATRIRLINFFSTPRLSSQDKKILADYMDNRMVIFIFSNLITILNYTKKYVQLGFSLEI